MCVDPPRAITALDWMSSKWPCLSSALGLWLMQSTTNTNEINTVENRERESKKKMRTKCTRFASVVSGIRGTLYMSVILTAMTDSHEMAIFAFHAHENGLN